MTNCNKCSHFHDLTSKLMCDLGIGEVIIIGPMKATMGVDQCQAYDGKEDEPKKPGRPAKHG